MKPNNQDYESLKYAYEELKAAYDSKCAETPAVSTSVQASLSDDDVRSFFTDFPSAKEEAASLAEFLASAENMDKTSLYTAYIAVLLAKIKPPEALVSDDDFLSSYVYSSPKVMKHFEERMGSSRPAVLRGIPAMTQPKKIKTLADAAEVARQLM